MMVLSEFDADRDLGQNGKIKSFVNPYSMKFFLNDETSNEIEFYSDGILTSIIFSLYFLKIVKRCSFDETSLAPKIYRASLERGLSISFIGGSSSEIELFSKKITEEYGCLNISYCRDGFFSKHDFSYVAEEIVNSGARVCVVGMGTPLQEQFSLFLIRYGFSGVVYTCGGYISQTALSGSVQYYPTIIDQLNLRFLYRFYKEPHTRKRYLVDYPVNIVKLLYLWVMRKVKLRLK